MFNPLDLISFFQTFDPLWLFFGQALLCGVLILLLVHFWGLLGLYLYAALATIGGNIAVLKVVSFPFYGKPIALGTILFMSLFLCSDITSEYFGRKHALRLIWVGFISYLIFSLFIYGILSYVPMDESLSVQNALTLLFIPAPAIFCASLTAYFISQYTDVVLYNLLRVLTGGKYLWLRSFVSTFLGAFLDNTVFSFLLWYVLMPSAKGFEEIFWTYIVGVFIMRIFLTFINVTFMYGVKKITFRSVNIV
jgi:uncharacterized integral membrane protein (TIGR00697 family)